MNRMPKPSLAILIAATLGLFYGCGLVRICIEKPKDIANAHLYTDQRPLTVEEMKHLLRDDSLHYKVMVFYSICCGGVKEQMRYVYNRLWDMDTAQVRWYFVLDDCSSLKYDATRFLRGYGIETPYMYYLRDDDPRFSTWAEDRFYTMAKYIFERNEDLEDVTWGVPGVFVVNPDGVLKTEYRRYADGTVVVANYDRLYELVYSQIEPDIIPRDTPLPIQSLDFYSRDTADYDWEAYNPEGREPSTPVGATEVSL